MSLSAIERARYLQKKKILGNFFRNYNEKILAHFRFFFNVRFELLAQCWISKVKRHFFFLKQSNEDPNIVRF